MMCSSERSLPLLSALARPLLANCRTRAGRLVELDFTGFFGNFTYRAVEAVDKTTVDRFDRVAEKVKEIAAGNGESDVRRLRRQFKSIKNTFIQYDVKDSFLEALSAGRPCAEVSSRVPLHFSALLSRPARPGCLATRRITQTAVKCLQEDAYHQQYQEEVDQFEANLKAHKAENRDLRKDVEDLIERVVNAREASTPVRLCTLPCPSCFSEHLAHLKTPHACALAV